MMRNDILISIIVPVYNLQDSLERCVSSILSQTYKNLEIILINDGSTDKSWNIIQKLAMSDKRVVPISKLNGGVTSARFAGLRIAKGEYIGFVDGDDEIEPDMYEFLLKNILHYNADISHCGYQMIFDDGRVNDFYNTGKIVIQDRLKGLKDLLEGNYVEPGLWNKLFHNQLLKKLLENKVMDLSISINEDLLMNYYLFSYADKSIYEDRCKYHYYVRSESAVHSKLSYSKIFDPINVRKIIMKEAQDKQIYQIAKKKFLGTCISVYNTLTLNGLKRFPFEAKKIKEELIDNSELYKSSEKKQRIIIWMILHLSYGYERIYKIYEKLFVNNRYK